MKALRFSIAALAFCFAQAAAAQTNNWAGGYAGANVGYSWANWGASSNQLIFDFEVNNANPHVNGAVGGIQGGYNIVSGTWLWGLEGDFQLSSERAHQFWTDPGLPSGPTSDFVPRCCDEATLLHQWELPWFSTLRLRGGMLVSPGWLIYATAGLAVGETRYLFSFNQPGSFPDPTSYTLNQRSTRFGYAAGFGTEYKLDGKWSIKFEYLFLDFGTVSIRTLDIDGAPFSVSYRAYDNIVRIGINRSFVP